MNIISRFAPSPTGKLHVGNLRTAIIAYFLSKKEADGKFILRIDDTDSARSTEGFVTQIRQDLSECGLIWDEEFRQSQKARRYNEIKEQLIQSGRLYPCYETQEELQMQRQIAIKNNKPFIYTKSNNKNEIIDENEEPHWRFELNRAKDILWKDDIKGEIKFVSSLLSDPVVIRADGSFTYLLISVIDDIDSEVNYIVRGEDHITNTASQIQMWEALNADIPRFAHLALLKMPEGKISKRKGGFEIRQLLDEGIMPITLLNYLSTLGSSKNTDDFKTSVSELIQNFKIEDCSSSSPNFDKQKLEALNLKILRSLDFETVSSFLKSKLQTEIDSELWNAIKCNIKTLGEILYWKNLCTNCEVSCDIEKTDELKNIAKLGLKFLPNETLDSDSWKNWVDKIFENNPSITKKEIFIGLRIILSGKNEGFEMKKLITLIGYNNLVKLLKNF